VKQLILASSLLSAVAALVMVAICVAMPKIEWILANIVFATISLV